MAKCQWKNGNRIPCEWLQEESKKEQVRILPTGEVYVHTISGPVYLPNCPGCGEKMEREISVEIGMFGRFWDEKQTSQIYGILGEITQDGKYVNKDSSYTYTYFSPGLPSDFNSDGTPKKTEG